MRSNFKDVFDKCILEQWSTLHRKGSTHHLDDRLSNLILHTKLWYAWFQINNKLAKNWMQELLMK